MTASPETSAGQKIRVLIAKPGLDGHDRGAKIVARALRDDVVGLSILSGAHLELFPRIVEELRSRGLDDVLLFCGGIIPEEDTDALEEMGFSAIFRPGTNTRDIVSFVYDNAASE